MLNSQNKIYLTIQIHKKYDSSVKNIYFTYLILRYVLTKTLRVKNIAKKKNQVRCNFIGRYRHYLYLMKDYNLIQIY